MTTSGEMTTFWPMLQPRPMRAPRHHVAEVPDLRALADLAAFVDERRGMGRIRECCHRPLREKRMARGPVVRLAIVRLPEIWT